MYFTKSDTEDFIYTPDEGIQYVFVYGSLRPDDDSGEEWTQEACDGMRGQTACVRGARMFKDTYAAVKLSNTKQGTAPKAKRKVPSKPKWGAPAKPNPASKTARTKVTKTMEI